MLAMLTVFSFGDVDTSTNRPEPAPVLRAGVAAVERRDWLGAQNAFEQAAGASADHSVRNAAALGVAESLFRQRRYAEAGKQFESLYDSNLSGAGQADSLVALRRAQCLAHQERWRDAAKVAQQALENQTHPTLRIPLAYLLGRCHTARGMHEEARAQYFVVVRSSHAADAMRARALWMIAYSYAAQGEVETAREMFLRIEEDASTDPGMAAGALVEAARCNEQQGQWRAAAAMYRRAVAKYSGAGISNEANRRLAVVQIRISSQQRR